MVGCMANGQVGSRRGFMGKRGCSPSAPLTSRTVTVTWSVLCTAGCGAASMVSTHRIPQYSLPPNRDNQKCLRTSWRVPWGHHTQNATHLVFPVSPAGTEGTPGSRNTSPRPQFSWSGSCPAPEESLAQMLPAPWVQPSGMATSFLGAKNCFQNQEEEEEKESVTEQNETRKTLPFLPVALRGLCSHGHFFDKSFPSAEIPDLILRLLPDYVTARSSRILQNSKDKWTKQIRTWWIWTFLKKIYHCLILEKKEETIYFILMRTAKLSAACIQNICWYSAPCGFLDD